MKITLKTIVLAALLAFYIMIILSNFSSLDGFTSSDSTVFDKSVVVQSSSVPSSKSTTLPSNPKT